MSPWEHLSTPMHNTPLRDPSVFSRNRVTCEYSFRVEWNCWILWATRDIKCTMSANSDGLSHVIGLFNCTNSQQKLYSSFSETCWGSGAVEWRRRHCNPWWLTSSNRSTSHMKGYRRTGFSSLWCSLKKHNCINIIVITCANSFTLCPRKQTNWQKRSALPVRCGIQRKRWWLLVPGNPPQCSLTFATIRNDLSSTVAAITASDIHTTVQNTLHRNMAYRSRNRSSSG